MGNPVQNKTKLGREVIFAMILGTAFVVFLIFFSRSWTLETAHPLKGRPAPEIEFSQEDGGKTSLSKQKGTTVLINFWASWCGPCMEEMPSLKALESHYADKGFLLLALNIEEGSGEEIQGKIRGSQMPRNLIYNFNKEYLRPYNVNSVPLSILIDKKGIIRKVYAGPRDWMLIENLREIESILNN